MVELRNLAHSPMRLMRHQPFLHPTIRRTRQYREVGVRKGLDRSGRECGVFYVLDQGRSQAAEALHYAAAGHGSFNMSE